MYDGGNLHDRGHLSVAEAAARLCAALFDSLPRRDQRRKAAEYITGLLGAPGRKSIRTIAALVGGPGAEQGLHHFISDSTWEWMPVRTALARYLIRDRRPHAWVVRPMMVPKAGRHSVGVARRFCAELGSTVNAQQAVGVWAAGAGAAVPVHWRLQLPREWLADPVRRARASIPDTARAESLDVCAIAAYLEVSGRHGLPDRPMLFDARESDAEGMARALLAARRRFLFRVGESLRLTPKAAPASALPAAQIARAAKRMCRQTAWLDPDQAPAVRTSLVAAVPVAMGAGEALLYCVSERGQNWPAELWLSNLPAVETATLLRLRGLPARVDRDFTEIADRVGTRDFAGRSFAGWHRHMTLACVAHAAVVLGDGDRERRQAS